MTMTDPRPPSEPIDRLMPHRDELTHYAARVLGSRSEVEDAVQETMVRAWNALDGFEGRSQLRSWLYRICTNVCLDMLASRERRARPMLEGPPSEIVLAAQSPIIGATRSAPDPADVVVERESVRLAVLAVLRYLPPKQRAALILREVLHWTAAEIAELLDTSIASVNSALQRARATLRVVRATSSSIDVDQETDARLDRYTEALASSDINRLVALLAREVA